MVHGLSLFPMELPSQASRNRRRSNSLARKKHRFAKRLRFLLLGLKMLDAFGPPIEKLVLTLIQECIAQIWPEPTRSYPSAEPNSRRQTISVTPSVRSQNARGI
jgi:hypothetical protein